MTPTIREVAARAGVSTSTVSHVLNGTHYVSPELTARVLSVVEELSYAINPVARSLAGGRSGVIGLLLPDLGVSYGGEIVRGIDLELADAGFQLLLHTTHNHTFQEAAFVSKLARGLTEGIILVLPLDPTTYLEPLHARQFPYVVVDHHGFDDFSPTVVCTNWQGAYDATTYLALLGHHRIGFIAGTPRTSSAGERMEGYVVALQAAGIAFDPELVRPGEFERIESYEAATALLALEDPPTAIFAANDVAAFGAVDAARNHGLRIPEDMSIVGFDDIPEAAAMRPALTTVRQPLVDIGRTAARMLLRYIEDPTRPTEHHVLDTTLIIRDSCWVRQPRKGGESKQTARRESTK